MILRLYLLSFLFEVVLTLHIDSRGIVDSQSKEVLPHDDEIEANHDLKDLVDMTGSADKLFAEGKCKNHFFFFFL